MVTKPNNCPCRYIGTVTNMFSKQYCVDNVSMEMEGQTWKQFAQPMVFRENLMNFFFELSIFYCSNISNRIGHKL